VKNEWNDSAEGGTMSPYGTVIRGPHPALEVAA